MWKFWKRPEKEDAEELVLLSNQFAETPVAPNDYPNCDCFAEFYRREDDINELESDEEADALESAPIKWSESLFHVDAPFRTQRAWDIACEIIDKAARRKRTELNLGKEMDRQDYLALHTLPASIGELKDLKKLVVYGSNLSSIPREIAGCENLKSFEPYTSYRLHWFPYELRRCPKLKSSCVSTRTLYGNYKLRPPFPDLSAARWNWIDGESRCSVCDTPSAEPEQFWISQAVATDVLPLLVSVCSPECLENVAPGAKDYLLEPHKGGLGIKQPPTRF